jgi:error-prone DNA polymerase
LGLRLVKGLSTAAAERIAEVRAIRTFASIDDLARRAELSQRDLQVLARANALSPITGHRRQASWQVAGMTPLPKLLKNAPIQEEAVVLPQASEGEEILEDYRSIGLTLGRHPLALLRDRLKAMRLSTSLEMKSFADRKLARTAGIVTMRQRPATANGTIFISLEDEIGTTNVIVWPGLVEKQSKEILNARLMTVYGVWQREGDVMHLVAKRVVDHTEMLGDLLTKSRDFH